MDHFVRDARQALKLLLKEKTFGATVLVTLAVCIGANVAIYGVVHRVLLEPLPFHEPGRLVTVFNSYPGAGAPRGANGTVDFFQRRANIDAFEEVALFQGWGATVGEAGSTERVAAMRVTPSFFPLIGVEAAIGRTFTEDEMWEGAHEKALLTWDYWQEHFGGAGDVVGRELRVNGRPYTVVGVLARAFQMPDAADRRFFVPIAFEEADQDLDRWHSNNFSMLARLAPGATIEQASAQNGALNQALIDQWPLPNARQLLDDVGYNTQIHPTQADLVRDVKPVLFMLWAGVGFVLLIGCVNIANLMLARAQARVAEVATKLALGAPRARVARQVLTESVVIALLGGVLGVGIGALGIRLLMTLGADDLPMGAQIDIDASVIGFTVLIAVGAGLLFGSIPMVQVLRGDLSPVFRTESRTGTASRRSVLLRNGLVTAQVALAFVMLIGAGLMLQSFRAALSVDPGFEPDGVLTAFVSLPESRYPDGSSRRALWDELLTEVRAIPGVAEAAVTSQLPFTGNNSNTVIFPEGYVPPPGESLISAYRTLASPRYFETLGVELVEGRGFEELDGPDGMQVIVIDEALARRFWPEGGALGSRMVSGAPPGQESEENLFTIVGVVRTVTQNDLTADPSEHVGAYYFSHKQITPGFVSLAVRAGTADPAALTPAVRDALMRLDPELPLFGVETLRGRIDESLTSRRVPLVLLGIFAGVALFLAVVGIYGALAYTVSQRTREIGIRMAMGSAPEDLFRSVVGQGVRVTGLGLVVGGVAAWLLTRFIESMLYGVEATDPGVMAVVALVLGVVGVVACTIPARRATTVDPVEALGG